MVGITQGQSIRLNVVNVIPLLVPDSGEFVAWPNSRGDDIPTRRDEDFDTAMDQSSAARRSLNHAGRHARVQ